ncbi:hypothetical protein WICPIJ_006342 [Wickerhamomyces pijperi]|uniref:ABC transporter domain-containing protein n=1 Tax=Wickerhamomyces pijperi TaxID=599730 RepID=A0A9P8Q4K7_WICPI|nr:hypothetical protein WICPIJ_006342 [Wickerhamomyces pijperi]
MAAVTNQLIRFEGATLKNFLSVKDSVSLFKTPLNFQILPNEKWAILGPEKSTLLKAIASKYIAEPPLSRTYPFLHQTQWPSEVIQFLEFKGVLPTAHLAARYEFFKDEFDQTTRNFVLGHSMNNLHSKPIDYELVERVFEQLQLSGLEDRWALGLSNGQSRRARLAKALIKEPKLLVVDDPFLGLDPEASELVSGVLKDLPPHPHVVLGLRYQDEIPKWITHLAFVDKTGIINQGTCEELSSVLEQVRDRAHHWNNNNTNTASKTQRQSVEKIIQTFKPPHPDATGNLTPLLQFKNVSVSYRGAPVITDLSWEVQHGSKWHVQGNNGAGKSTLLSLITADHPQSWNSSIEMYGEPRRTGKHSFFGINESIGFSSPELHSIFPNSRTFYETVATGFIVGSFITPTDLTNVEKQRIQTYLESFGITAEQAQTPFRELSISDQKLALFIRAIIKNPDLLILDEALSVMEQARIEQCKEILKGFPGAVLAIGHIEQEVPQCDHFIKLIRPGEYIIGDK